MEKVLSFIYVHLIIFEGHPGRSRLNRCYAVCLESEDAPLDMFVRFHRTHRSEWNMRPAIENEWIAAQKDRKL